MSNNRYVITKQWIERFQQAIDDLELANYDSESQLVKAQLDSLYSQLRDLENELLELEPENNG